MTKQIIITLRGQPSYDHPFIIQLLYMLILSLILHLTILRQINPQAQAILTQTPNIECNNYQIFMQNSSNDQRTLTLTYINNYSSYPYITLSINTFDSFALGQDISYINQPKEITLSSTIISYRLDCSISEEPCTINLLKISYIIYDYRLHQFVHFLEVNFTINPAVTIDNQFYLINYLKLLDSDQYQLECSISGFKRMNIFGLPYLEINVAQASKQSYLLNINFKNLNLEVLYFTRIMINIDQINAQAETVNKLDCEIGTIYHYADPLVINQNRSPDYLPFAMFFGIKKFTQWHFSIDLLTYVFNNSNPGQQINIAYVLFKTKACPTNLLYVGQQNLCYSLSNAFYYQVSPTQLVPCPYSCYQCVGPLTTNCRSCLTGHNRILSGGRCRCIPSFYDPGDAICKNCTEAIAGCKQCSSVTSCTQCLTGCTAIGFSPIYCDCPFDVRTNSSYNCPRNYYFQPDLNQCTCMPQTYLNQISNLCQSCVFGCYKCNSLSVCTQCIDSYIIINHTCIYFYLSYALVGQISYLNSPQIRCLRFDRYGNCLQKCRKFYYQSTCYGACPVGTFNISFPWLTCQRCKQSCQMCYNYTICYLCNENRYYFNTSILSCSPCSSDCLNCTNASVCLNCSFPYKLISGICVMEALPSVVCSETCNYCLFVDNCLSCKIPYFLNESSKKCIECSRIYGLAVGSGGCFQICGDGLIVNDKCDDGNLISGDGCDSHCRIESSFSCKRFDGKSYCWSSRLSVNWAVYSYFLENKLTIKVSSSGNMRQVHSLLACSFDSQLKQSKNEGNKLLLTIEYKESLLQYLYFYNFYQISKVNPNKSNLCILTINKMQKYYIYISSYPEPVFENYSTAHYQIINSQTLNSINTALIYITIASLVIGLSSISSHLTTRFYILILFTYRDAYQMPLNSFASYISLQSLLFTKPSLSTENLIFFSSDATKNTLLNIILLYVGVVIWQEAILRLWVKVCRNMDWKFLSRWFSLVEKQKFIIYSSLYISYELIVINSLVETIVNVGQAQTDLIILSVFHFCILIATKIHFYYAFELLQKDHSGLAYYFIIEQTQNIVLAVLAQFSIEKASFVPIIIIIFSVVSLYSIRNTFQEPKPRPLLSEKITFVCFRIYCLLQILIQVLKECNLLRGMLNIDQHSNEELSLKIGLCVGYVIAFGVTLGGVMGIFTSLCWLKEVRVSGLVTIPNAVDGLNENDNSLNAF